MNKSTNTDSIVKETIDNGRCLVKVTDGNKKEVIELVNECEIDKTVRAVPWSSGKNKYVLFVDEIFSEQKEGKVVFVDFKSKKVFSK